MRIGDLFERAEGPPPEVFHGTGNADFTRFSTKRGGMGGQLGYWFATTEQAARQFARSRFAGRRAGIKVCRLRIEQPMEFHDYREYLDAVEKKRGRGSIEDGVLALRRSLIRQGYDGVVIRNSDTDSGGVRDDWVAFHPQQIECLRTITTEAAEGRFGDAMQTLRAAATPGDQMRGAMTSLSDFLGDQRPIEQKYTAGDTLLHRSTGEVVDVLSTAGGPQPILTVKIRSTGRQGQFYADEFDPAPVEHWRRADESAHPAAEALARWFAGSKIVDAEGRPLRLYHGTSKDQDFKSFKMPRNGAWFAADPKEASQYAEENDSQKSEWDSWERRFVPKNTAARVIPVFVRAVNPKHYDGLPEELRHAENYKRAQAEHFDRLRAQGHDAVVMGSGSQMIVVALGSPQQIKSAIGNRSFDPAKKGLTEGP